MSEKRDPETDQALPEGNDLPVMHNLVSEDLQKRLRLGISKYGQPLQPFNGRSFLRDAYEEVLDLAVYLRGAIYEAENPSGVPLEDEDDLCLVINCDRPGTGETDDGQFVCDEHMSPKKTPSGHDIFKDVCMECMNQRWVENDLWSGGHFDMRTVENGGLIPCLDCNSEGNIPLAE